MGTEWYQDEVTWMIDGVAVGAGATVWWSPKSGHHSLVLNDSQGKEIGKISFEVRGDQDSQPK